MWTDVNQHRRNNITLDLMVLTITLDLMVLNITLDLMVLNITLHCFLTVC